MTKRSRYQMRKAEQEAVDQRHRAERYTGGEYDALTGDYQVWVRGEIVGWAPSQGEAMRRAYAAA